MSRRCERTGLPRFLPIRSSTPPRAPPGPWLSPLAREPIRGYVIGLLTAVRSLTPAWRVSRVGAVLSRSRREARPGVASTSRLTRRAWTRPSITLRLAERVFMPLPERLAPSRFGSSVGSGSAHGAAIASCRRPDTCRSSQVASFHLRSKTPSPRAWTHGRVAGGRRSESRRAPGRASSAGSRRFGFATRRRVTCPAVHAGSGRHILRARSRSRCYPNRNRRSTRKRCGRNSIATSRIGRGCSGAMCIKRNKCCADS